MVRRESAKKDFNGSPDEFHIGIFMYLRMYLYLDAACVVSV
jgi:hypothetical protein